MINVAKKLADSGQSLEQISERSGIAVDRLAAIVGGADFSIAELKALAAAINAEMGDFVEEPPLQQKAEMLFRQVQQKPLRRRASSAVHAFSKHIANTFLLIEEHNEQPEWLRHFDVQEETYASAESNAALFRQLFYNGDVVSPLLALPEILVNQLGAIVFVVSGQRVDGASALVGGQPFVFLSPRFPPRMLFTLAHECGHLIAHHGKNKEFAVVDDHVSGNIRPRKKRAESFADAFASCLLMPPAGVGVALKAVRKRTGVQSDALGDIEILYLAHIFGVSFQVAAKRCEDLNLLPQGSALSMYEHLCKEFGSPEKRAEEASLPPRPEINIPPVPMAVVESAIKKVRRGELSIGKVSAIMNIAIPDLYRLNAKLAQ